MNLYHKIEQWCDKEAECDSGIEKFELLKSELKTEGTYSQKRSDHIVWMDACRIIGLTYKENINPQYYLKSRPLKWKEFLVVNAKHMLNDRWYYGSDNLKRLKQILKGMYISPQDVCIRMPTISIPLLVEPDDSPMVIFVAQRAGRLSPEHRKILEVGFKNE
ncbi:hypothetical protein [Candidatus Bathycorpusculum sp.]|uniref:hypothetical protein n=1 Tax=Candidatus Bathycorpusculum sp. TaxID=2994959 RepID=UPI002837B932|nr:hypothetical protein [Candidatus Termitimicrobium sp.]MCL2432081.1 hypothetical protein [Candidatus Termitimicrobium sp.]